MPRTHRDGIPVEERVKRFLRYLKYHSPADAGTLALYMRCSETRALAILRILVKRNLVMVREETTEEAIRRFRSRPRVPFQRSRFRKRTLFMLKVPELFHPPAPPSEQLQLDLEGYKNG